MNSGITIRCLFLSCIFIWSSGLTSAEADGDVDFFDSVALAFANKEVNDISGRGREFWAAVINGSMLGGFKKGEDRKVIFDKFQEYLSDFSLYALKNYNDEQLKQWILNINEGLKAFKSGDYLNVKEGDRLKLNGFVDQWSETCRKEAEDLLGEGRAIMISKILYNRIIDLYPYFVTQGEFLTIHPDIESIKSLVEVSESQRYNLVKVYIYGKISQSISDEVSFMKRRIHNFFWVNNIKDKVDIHGKLLTYNERRMRFLTKNLLRSYVSEKGVLYFDGSVNFDYVKMRMTEGGAGPVIIDVDAINEDDWVRLEPPP